ncbi:MAG: flagellin [Proteobacteria bacterium]|nr:flagellin [Pseudomonadota bacterium]
MSLVLNTNLSSLVAQNSLTSSGSQLSGALQQLSSGLRINTAADDAAGYAISQSMTSQINGINQAARNANDGVSLAQTASGALQEVVNDLQTMRDLAVQSLNATNSSIDRQDLDAQFQQLKLDVDSVATQTQFNGVNLLDGTFQGASFQVGANSGQTITVASIGSSKTSNIGQYYQSKLAVAGTVTTSAGAQLATVAGTAGTYNATNLAGTADLGTAVSGATVSLTVTVDGTAYTTSNITLTGNQATDLRSTAAAINQAISPVNGLTATVNAAGTGIQIGGTVYPGAGHVIDTSVATAHDASGTALTLTTAQQGTITTDLGVDSSDMVGYYTAGGVTTTSSTAATLSGLDVQSVDKSNLVLISIDAALQQLATEAAQLGAYQNRFQAAITGLTTNSTNLTSARSQIQDTDYAATTSKLSKAQILQQASTAMVSQANTIPQNILTLLQKLP